MPFEIHKVKNHWKIYKSDIGKYTKPKFKTKQSAINQANNWMRYAHQKIDQHSKK